MHTVKNRYNKLLKSHKSTPLTCEDIPTIELPETSIVHPAAPILDLPVMDLPAFVDPSSPGKNYNYDFGSLASMTCAQEGLKVSDAMMAFGDRSPGSDFDLSPTIFLI